MRLADSVDNIYRDSKRVQVTASAPQVLPVWRGLGGSRSDRYYAPPHAQLLRLGTRRPARWRGTDPDLRDAPLFIAKPLATHCCVEDLE